MADTARPRVTPTALTLVGIIVVSIIAGVFLYRAVDADRTAFFMASQFRLNLQTYLTLVVDQETAVRAYDATRGTGSAGFLQPFRASRPQYDAVLAALLADRAKLPQAAERVRAADALHRRWLIEIAGPIMRRPGNASNFALEARGKRIVDALRAQILPAQTIAARAATERRLAAGRSVAFSIAVIVLFVVVAGLIALRSERRFALDQQRLRAEIERRNAALERSNHALQEFAYVASHDLQEPLRSVASFTQLLRKRYGPQLDVTANEYIDFAVDGAVRMQRLIDDILAYSRVTTHGKPLQPVDLNESAARAIANLRFTIEQSGAAVRTAPLPRVLGDPVQLAQLLQNLIGNALKYGGTPAEVSVTAAREGEVWRVCVADNGIGIAPEYHERVFRIFQRLHTRAEYSGTGIGLAICKGIVERHGGRIWVESQAGRGATFCFTLRDARKEARETA